MATPFADTIGYFALLLSLYSMSVKGEKRLRTISLAANGIYIFYGILTDALPIAIGCSVALILHGYRLYKIKATIYGTNKIG
ncbi:hypothetical protein GTQ34_03260 [Muricauda sp. JGD-17]|uniref:Inner membrane protein n=1 Tax=Flagellimonas ochracea TaxID=2696472 RepID=A0A964T9W3_9FLAO|nr:hypothetical protein [Allomuricauda ochracea]NAY90927.1 hypothetical protein [Allomuricauda ochracea]